MNNNYRRDMPYKRLTISIPKELYDTLQKKADRDRRTVSNQILVLLEKALDKKFED